MKFKKFRKGILIGMCTLVMAGCGVSENGGAKNNDHVIDDSKDGHLRDETDNMDDDHLRDETDNMDDDHLRDETDNMDDDHLRDETNNTDGDSLISSSDLQGRVIEFSENGCVVTPVTNDGNTAAVAAPGNEKEETNVTISYEPDCIFQTAVMDLTTGTANISKAAVSDIKKQTSLLIYGSSEDTHNFSASKVIIVRYE